MDGGRCIQVELHELGLTPRTSVTEAAIAEGVVTAGMGGKGAHTFPTMTILGLYRGVRSQTIAIAHSRPRTTQAEG
jgi:hypothetical protein